MGLRAPRSLSDAVDRWPLFGGLQDQPHQEVDRVDDLDGVDSPLSPPFRHVHGRLCTDPFDLFDLFDPFDLFVAIAL